MDILDPLGPAPADPLVKALPKADLHLHQEVTARLDRLAGSLRSRGSGTGTQKAVGSRQSAVGTAPADHPLPAAGSWASPNSGLLPTDPRSPIPGRVHRALLVFEKLSCRLADHVIATNESYKAVEMQRGGVPEERITIVRN